MSNTHHHSSSRAHPPEQETKIDRSQSLPQVSRDAIAARAYEKYIARSCVDGHDQRDWIEAEQELTSC